MTGSSMTSHFHTLPVSLLDCSVDEDVIHSGFVDVATACGYIHGHKSLTV